MKRDKKRKAKNYLQDLEREERQKDAKRAQTSREQKETINPMKRLFELLNEREIDVEKINRWMSKCKTEMEERDRKLEKLKKQREE